MLGARVILARRSKDEGEKPFWISYADLMTALMVLFLVVMAVALLAVTRKIDEAERIKNEREVEIQELLKRVEAAAHKFPGVKVDKEMRRVDFGPMARFDFKKHTVSPDTAVLLRAFVPELLAIARDKLGQKWVKQIVVEGFTDSTGTYLYNLDLSLKRSEAVLCALFSPPRQSERPMAEDELRQIQQLFLVGGFSFNSAKQNDEESRRVEFKLDFLGIGEARPVPSVANGLNIGTCQVK